VRHGFSCGCPDCMEHGPERPWEGRAVADERMSRRYVIHHPNGTYYQGDSPIGPTFGAHQVEALKFRERRSAEWLLADWRFVGCEIEEVSE